LPGNPETRRLALFGRKDNRRGKIAARKPDDSLGDVILIVGRRRAASTVKQLPPP
jgi:hypothetical protein